MFRKLRRIGEMYNSYMTKRGRAEAHSILLNLDNKMLADIGISRDALEGGVTYWPWDEAALARENAKLAGLKLDTTAQKAVRELDAYTDRELHDLGINRGMITDAVKNGRVGIENSEVANDPNGLQAA